MITDTAVLDRVGILQDTLLDYQMLPPEEREEDSKKQAEGQMAGLVWMLYDYTQLSSSQPIYSKVEKRRPLHQKMIYRMLNSLFVSIDMGKLRYDADTLFAMFCSPQEEQLISEEIDKFGDEACWGAPMHLTYLVKAYNCYVQGVDVTTLERNVQTIKGF